MLRRRQPPAQPLPEGSRPGAHLPARRRIPAALNVDRLGAAAELQWLAVSEASGHERGRRRAARRDWSGDRVLDALRTWAREEGRPPRAHEWNPARAAALGITSAGTRKWEREVERWSSLDVAVRRFGSWRAALQAAGLPSYPPLVLPLRERVAIAQRLRGVCTVHETAELVGVSHWTIYGYWNAVRCAGCGGWQIDPQASGCNECRARARQRPQLAGRVLLDLLRAWARETGEPPRVTDWTGENPKWDREYP